MKLTMQLTLDGLLKGLKARGHEIAERVEEDREAEHGDVPPGFEPTQRLRPAARLHR